jgi:hypothetical protein
VLLIHLDGLMRLLLVVGSLLVAASNEG